MYVLHNVMLPNYLHLTECRPGLGALARNGTFWYPVQLLQHVRSPERHWTVRWWRGCRFDASIKYGVEAGSVSAVPEGDIVVALWGDQQTQRQT